MTDVVYRIDATDRLIHCNPAWDLFAQANQAPGLMTENLLAEKEGPRSLWDFIDDPQTRHFTHLLLARVRKRKAPVLALPFRCDAPEVRRYMRMDIVPLPDGAVEYRCCVVSEQKRPAPLPLHHCRNGEQDGMLRLCSWCNRVDAHNDEWLELDVAATRFQLFALAEIPSVTHTICNTCMSLLDDDAGLP